MEGIEEILDDNKVNITFKINLGDKQNQKNIFIGNKIFKDNKLKES